MIQDIIKNYIENNNIKNYKLIPKYWTLDEWNSDKTLILGSNLAFIYDFRAFGIINNITDITKKFFVLSSDNTLAAFIDYKNIISFKEVSGGVEVKSDFISIHQNRITLDYDLSNNIFSQIYQAHISYYNLTPIK